MNYKFQFSPMSGTHTQAGSPFGENGRATLADAKFFRSWLVYDSDLDATRSSGRINWNIVAGLLLVAAVSAAGWSGVVLLARHFLR